MEYKHEYGVGEGFWANHAERDVPIWSHPYFKRLISLWLCTLPGSSLHRKLLHIIWWSETQISQKKFHSKKILIPHIPLFNLIFSPIMAQPPPASHWWARSLCCCNPILRDSWVAISLPVGTVHANSSWNGHLCCPVALSLFVFLLLIWDAKTILCSWQKVLDHVPHSCYSLVFVFFPCVLIFPSNCLVLLVCIPC